MDRYRVGRHWPGNIYRDDERFAFCLRNEDGPLVVEALNSGESLRFFLAGVLSLSANQARSLSTMDMVTMLAHQRDEARSALDYGGRQ